MQNKPKKLHYLFIIVIFIVTLFFGYFLSKITGYGEDFLGNAFGFFALLDDLPQFYLFLAIFLNNTIKVFVAILLGLFFGLYPIYFIGMNGFIIGLVVAQVSKQIGLIPIIAGLLPHGILEIPAMIIGTTYGFWLGVEFYKYVKNKKNFSKQFTLALKKFAVIVLPLLLIAAIIETYLTPLVMDRFLN